MSYTPTNWDNGDIITAEKLNKIEQGISDVSNSSGEGNSISDIVFDITFTVDLSDPDNPIVTCDKTFAQYETAHEAGKIIRAVAVGIRGVGDDSVYPFSEYDYAFSGPYVVTPTGTFIGPVQWGDNDGTAYLWWPIIYLEAEAVVFEKWTYPVFDD